MVGDARIRIIRCQIHLYAEVIRATTLHYAEAVRDGKLTIPIDRIMLLANAAEAHATAEKGGIAKIVLTT